MDLADKVVVVTGAGNGIGRQVVFDPGPEMGKGDCRCLPNASGGTGDECGSPDKTARLDAQLLE